MNQNDELKESFDRHSAAANSDRGLQLLDELTRRERLRDKLIAQDAWLADNADAIDAYNEHVSEAGSYSDTVRKF